MSVHARLARFVVASALASAFVLPTAALALPTGTFADTSPNLAASIPSPAPASRVVEIDGRFYTIELSINRYIGGAPGPDGPNITTGVNVQLLVRDGALLPENLRAAGVRFETVRGPRRVLFSPLAPVDVVIADDQIDHPFELDFQHYVGDLSERRAVRFLRTTVRLVFDGEIIRVPFGVLPVNVTPLP